MLRAQVAYTTVRQTPFLIYKYAYIYIYTCDKDCGMDGGFSIKGSAERVTRGTAAATAAGITTAATSAGT